MSHDERLPGDLEALLRAEKDAPSPDGEARTRVATRLSQTLGVALVVPGAAAPIAAKAVAAKAIAAKAVVAKSLTAKLILASVIAAGGGGAFATYHYLHTRASTPAGSRSPAVAGPTVAAPPVVAPAVAPAVVAPVVAPAVVAPTPPSAGPAAPSAAPPPPRRAHHADLAAERALLGEARAALQSSDPTRALAILDDHARRFSRGQLAEERDALRIRALFIAGDRAAARRRADEFARRHPDSLFLPSVRQTVTDPPAAPQ